jgi:type IV secretory pathway VirB2 component (pilin)
METGLPNTSRSKRWGKGALTFAACIALPENALAQQTGLSPWENAVQVLRTFFTGPIATGLSLVAIVVVGLVFAFSVGIPIYSWPSSFRPRRRRQRGFPSLFGCPAAWRLARREAEGLRGMHREEEETRPRILGMFAMPSVNTALSLH